MRSNIQSPGVVQTYGAQEAGTFFLGNVAKIIRTVITGLYSDKMRAPIREYLTNAWDVSPNNIKIRIPSRMDPTFSVRDFGTGLSHEDILNRFGGLGVSTKDETNDVAGMLGYGCKSGFAYTTVYNVVNFDGKEKRVYSMSMGEDGVPRITLHGTTPCDEPSGIEVSFAVKNEDVQAFRDKLRYTLYGFDSMPEWTDRTFLAPDKPTLTGEGWRMYSNSEIKKPHARMGCVIYPIDMNQLRGTSYGDDQLPIVMDFQIGELDIADSRESLGYDQRTKEALNLKWAQVQKEMFQKAQDEISAQPNLLEAWKLYLKIIKTAHYRFAQKLRGELEYGGVKIWDNLSLSSFEGEGMEIQADTIRNVIRKKTYSWQSEDDSPGNRRTRQKALTEAVSGSLAVVVHIGRLSAHSQRLITWAKGKADTHTQFLWIRTDSVDTRSFKRLMLALGNPEYDLLSEVGVEKVVSDRARVKSTPLNKFTRGGWEYCQTDPSLGGLYMPMFDGLAQLPDGTRIDNKEVRRLFSLLPGYENITLYGIPASYKNVPKKHKGWVTLHEQLKKEYKKKQHLVDAVLDRLSYNDYRMDSMFSALRDLERPDLIEFPEPTLSNDEATYLSSLSRAVNLPMVRNTDNKYAKRLNELREKLPMLDLLIKRHSCYFSDSDKPVIRTYVDAIYPTTNQNAERNAA